MQEIKEQRLTGERALFRSKDLSIEYSIFADGESPLKESRDISLKNTSFQWKYPLWYCRNITVQDCDFAEMARAGIWYTDNITVADTLYEAPKGFRRVKGLTLRNVDLPHAEETLWHCSDVTLENVVAKGDYFAMNCDHMKLDQFRLVGNYCFDGCHDVEVHHAKMLSKDAFWNCENIMVYDSYICGEYLGWNSRNVTFVNCVIESLQGMCYMDNVVMKNCRLLNTTLAFEYSTADVETAGRIESVKNPSAGVIRAGEIGELILNEKEIDPAKTTIITVD
ncbi:putative uncharacterized protein [Roseburia sp. CAG:380]|jgi:hypothetical protein|uniref:DUF3737 family protein n=1 Tax=Roseburia sp. AM59-24XD TaxID=2293138 RepID=UPI0003357E06|nr:DUF3737 family protein [Roseburia sp. AM59-24XD]MBS5663820.1 DUF3737 family protein [Roseburia sp.]RHP88971.1 DUF3737 family protein [Roseburia sp. AM59-24XD]CDC92870.1 putative uncharacterized protein [Roseburia sp. CAG:380]HCS15594.1 DUF3737 domain-containing protein [Lachnospiraceae bacterium]